MRPEKDNNVETSSDSYVESMYLSERRDYLATNDQIDNGVGIEILEPGHVTNPSTETNGNESTVMVYDEPLLPDSIIHLHTVRVEKIVAKSTGDLTALNEIKKAA